MSDLKDRVLSVAAFNKKSLGLREWIAPDGAYLRPSEVYRALDKYDARLRPLLEALAEAVAALECKSCAQYISIGAECRKNQSDKCLRCSALAAVEAAVEAMGGGK
jgi:hypothetical protein